MAAVHELESRSLRLPYARRDKWEGIEELRSSEAAPAGREAQEGCTSPNEGWESPATPGGTTRQAAEELRRQRLTK